MRDHLGTDQLGQHSPLSFRELSELMLAAAFEWCVAGGLAIDAAIGRVTRRHDDLDIAIFRKDQISVRTWFDAWELWWPGPPGSGLTRLRADDELPDTAHNIWCRRHQSEKWSFEVLIEESSGGRWLYRRHPAVTLPISDLIHDVEGIPVMAPEIVLLYKAKQPRERDAADFKAALPLLSAEQRAWLRAAVSAAHPDCAWLTEL